MTGWGKEVARIRGSGQGEELGPLAVSLEGKTLAVVSIDKWAEEEADLWEPEPVWKMHYQVIVSAGVC